MLSTGFFHVRYRVTPAITRRHAWLECKLLELTSLMPRSCLSLAHPCSDSRNAQLRHDMCCTIPM